MNSFSVPNPTLLTALGVVVLWFQMKVADVARLKTLRYVKVDHRELRVYL